MTRHVVAFMFGLAGFWAMRAAEHVYDTALAADDATARARQAAYERDQCREERDTFRDRLYALLSTCEPRDEPPSDVTPGIAGSHREGE